MRDLTGAVWHKSTRSGDRECVEVAGNLVGVVAVRDSKDRDGGVLVFPQASWSAFLADVKAGHLTL